MTYLVIERFRGGDPARVEIREGVHDAFYGMREFIIRDVNGFWITFGEPSRARGRG